MQFPSPDLDPERASAVRRLYRLDAGADATIARLAATAAEMAGAASAAVLLVDATGAPLTCCQVGSGAPGLDAYAVLRSGEAIAAGAYAASALRGTDGAAIGVLAVADDEPREWSGRDLRFIQVMADAVSAELALRRERAESLAVRREKEHLQATLDHIPSAAWLKDRDGRYLLLNRAGASLLGRTPGEAVGKTDRELFPPGQARQFVENDQRAMENGVFHVGEETTPGTPSTTWDVIKIAYRDAAGQLAGTVGIAHDVTARKRMERALRDREEQFRQIAENIREIFWLFDATFTRPIYVSPAYEEVWGRTVQSVYDDPTSFLDAVHPDDVAEVAAAMMRVSQGIASRIEYRVRRPDGSVRWVWSRGFPVHDANGCVYRVVGTTEDITGRKQAEEERRLAETRYRRLVENAPDVVYELDREGRFTELNPAAADLLGRDPAELIGQSFAEVVDPEDLPKGLESLRRKLEGQVDTTDLEVRLVRASGERRLVHIRATRVVQDGEIVGTLGIVRDITRERERERTMRLLDAAVSSFKEGVSLTDQDFRLIYANAAYCRMLGIGPDEWPTLDIPSLAPDDQERARAAELRRTLTEQGSWSGRIWRRRVSDGVVIPLDMIAGSVQAPSGERNLFFIFHEAAEALEREVRLRRAERLASVGTLIGGVAHELNNPLHAIRNFAELMLMEPRGADDQEALEVMRREAERAAKVVSDLRLIARDTQEKGGERTTVDLNDVVRHVLKLRRYSLQTGNVEIVEDLAVRLAPVLGNRGELEQVVLNLAVNAEQALHDTGGPRRLTLRTRRTAAGACVSVADTGRGIPPAYLERIFDPFFTTKAPGEGTGLGLSLVHSIVAEHGGQIHVDSEPGKGTTFRVDLPLAPAGYEHASNPLQAAGPATPRRVLVVDDEDAIRRVTVRLLRRMGHHAEAAAEGGEALRLLDAGDYDVILSDLRMPGLGGEELLLHLRARGLERRLVFVTGDAATGQAARVAAEANVPVLVKPVDLQDLVRAVEQAAVDGSGPGEPG